MKDAGANVQSDAAKDAAKNAGTNVQYKCSASALTASPNYICRTMETDDLRKVFDECAKRDMTPTQLAGLGEFEMLPADIKKLVRGMYSDIVEAQKLENPVKVAVKPVIVTGKAKAKANSHNKKFR